MKKFIITLIISTLSLFAEITGCKYKSDIEKLHTEKVSIQFKYDNHCNNISNPANWKKLKTKGRYTQIQSPYPNEESYKYWVLTSEIPKEIKKIKEKVTSKKNYKSSFEYGDLIWQDSLLNESKLMQFKEAKKYCKNLNYKSYKDWRLPSLSEFRQIRPSFSEYQPYKFKHINLKEWYWTNNINSQFVFSTGATTYGGNNPALVRCVTQRR